MTGIGPSDPLADPTRQPEDQTMQRDHATEVGRGEKLDLARLGEFLRDQIPGLHGDIRISRFLPESPNLTYLVEAGGRELVLRCPSSGSGSTSGQELVRAFRVLKALFRCFPYSPRPLLFCSDGSILGAPFYAMARLRGTIVHRTDQRAVDLPPATVRQQHLALVKVIRDLHTVDYRAIGLADLGFPEGYACRQVQAWSRLYRRARTLDVPDFEPVMAWLQEKLPAALERSGGERDCLVHNDFKLDKVIWDEADPTRMIGVLDWEMAAIGHPLMDLGSSLGYWVQQDDPEDLREITSTPTDLPGALTRRELIDRYAEATGVPLDNFDLFYCFGLFRRAVIAQQAYFRSPHKRNPSAGRARLRHTVRVLEKTSMRVIRQSTL